MAPTILRPPEERKEYPLRQNSRGATEVNPIRIAVKPTVLVAIPCYNEEISIGSVVLRARAYADKVVVVDDGSCDKTAEIARLAGAEVILHEVNKGKGASIRTAFEYAKRYQADVLVLIDGDGQHNPDEIPLLLAPILNGEADMVNGSRFLVKNGHRVPTYRRVGQDVLTLATNAGSGQKITDSQNGFRAFSRRTFGCFLLGENGMGIESEILLDAARANLRVKEVQIDVRYDVDGSTYNPVVHGFEVLGSLLKTISKRRMVLAYGLPGLVLTIAGVIALSYLALHLQGTAANLAIGYMAFSIMCIITGVLCFFTLLTLRSVQGFVQQP